MLYHSKEHNAFGNKYWRSLRQSQNSICSGEFSASGLQNGPYLQDAPEGMRQAGSPCSPRYILFSRLVLGKRASDKPIWKWIWYIFWVDYLFWKWMPALVRLTALRMREPMLTAPVPCFLPKQRGTEFRDPALPALGQVAPPASLTGAQPSLCSRCWGKASVQRPGLCLGEVAWCESWAEGGGVYPLYPTGWFDRTNTWLPLPGIIMRSPGETQGKGVGREGLSTPFIFHSPCSLLSPFPLDLHHVKIPWRISLKGNILEGCAERAPLSSLPLQMCFPELLGTLAF